MPEVLENLKGYLQQILSMKGIDLADVPPTLIQDVEVAAGEARRELEGKS